MSNSVKRSYHPLVIFFYYSGLLSPEQLAQIPKTTLDYWRSNDHTMLFGFEWVSGFYSSYEDFVGLQKHSIIYKATRFCCKLADMFSLFYINTKSYRKLLKKNSAAVIRTIDWLCTAIPLEKACRAFNITTQKYYRLKNKLHCTASVLNLCYKTHTHQLTLAECSAIKEAVNHPDNYRRKLSSTWYMLMRQGRLYCSRTAFYKYAKLVSEKALKLKYCKDRLSLKASRPFQFIHIDTTFLPTVNDGTVRAVVIKDNYSKNILHQGIVENGESKWIAALLKETFSRYGLYSHAAPVAVVSDGGPKNKGKVLTWMNSLNEKLVCKKTARTKDFAFTNNEVESVFNIFKNEFLDREIIDKEDARRLLQEFQNYNDNERYPLALYGSTPQEVFDGEPIDKDRFRERIKEARKVRHQKNKAGKFCGLCS